MTRFDSSSSEVKDQFRLHGKTISSIENFLLKPRFIINRLVERTGFLCQRGVPACIRLQRALDKKGCATGEREREREREREKGDMA